MWISNTATTAMMVPIAEAVLQEIKAENLDKDEEEIAEENGNSLELVDAIGKEPNLEKEKEGPTKEENEAEADLIVSVEPDERQVKNGHLT